MDAWLREWIEKRFGPTDPDQVRLETFAGLGIMGELAVWHPLGDLHTAPRLPFDSTVQFKAIWIAKQLAGYVLRGVGEVASWRELGDASTDTDRFFVVEVDQSELIIDWFNEDPKAFEQLGGDASVVSTDHETTGARAVVILSPDGNARLRGGFTARGKLACAVIEC